jgi:hypothetical protein
VEERLVGGECGFYASMPSKALLHPAEALDEIRHVPGAREAADGQRAVQAVLDNRDSIISDRDDSDQLPWLDDNDISLYRGHGRIAGDGAAVVPRRRGHEGGPSGRQRRGHRAAARRSLVHRGRAARRGRRHIDSDELGLDTIGLKLGRHGYLAVDEHLQIPGHDWRWVVGDANGRVLLTHMAKHQARVAADRITGMSDAALWDRADGAGAPWENVHRATGGSRRPHRADRARRGHRRPDRLRRHLCRRGRTLWGATGQQRLSQAPAPNRHVRECPFPDTRPV